MAAERSEALARLFAQAKSVTIAMTVAAVCYAPRIQIVSAIEYSKAGRTATYLIFFNYQEEEWSDEIQTTLPARTTLYHSSPKKKRIES